MSIIVLTGGGTAGHVTPNMALIPELQAAGHTLYYIGSYQGIEKELIEKMGVKYYGISSGKLRRYFDLKNFGDPFRVLKGYSQAKKLMKELTPDLVFSKGGFVAVPVVRAAAKRKIPIIIHESDMTPGLANRLCIPVATKICANFPETMQYLPEAKAVLTGTPIRTELYHGNKLRGLDYCGFTANRPVLMVVGGSTGAQKINEAIRNLLPTLLKEFQVVHLCGKGKADSSVVADGYVQFEYVNDKLPDVYAAADLVISRAGANVLCELLALRKPNILIPLSAAASRGDQIINAESFATRKYSYVIEEESLTNESLLEAVQSVYTHTNEYVSAMSTSEQGDATGKILALIEEIKAK